MTNHTDHPLLSALMLIGKTPLNTIKHAIACFKAQTYPYKELIIINNAKTQWQASEFSPTAERDVFTIDLPANLTAGAAKNHGIAAANGQIIAQFDVDCYHAPTRLENQVTALAAENAQVSVLTSITSYSFISGRARYLTNQQQAILNTMVYLRPANIDYPNLDKLEELGMLSKLQEIGWKTISMPLPSLICKYYFATNPIKKPINCGLTTTDFDSIKTILKNYNK